MNRFSLRHFIVGATYAGAASTFPRASRADEYVRLSNDLPADLLGGIDKQRDHIVAAMAKSNVPGAAVALVYEGQIVWTEGFGVTDCASGGRVGTDTIFSIQSISKNLTATVVMLAVQKGILDLDKPITAYLPGFTVHSRFEDAPQRKMTLQLLLGHRAGFTHEAPVGNNYYPESPGFEAHVRSISNTWLRYPVGERYSYSNLGFDLAGYCLQQASGVPFEDFVKTALLDPLGMANTTFSGKAYTISKDRAVGSQPGYEAVPLITPLIPSGGAYTSAKDMGTYALFHLNKGMSAGTRVLDERLWQEMHTLQPGAHYCLGITRTQVKFGERQFDWFNHNGGGFGFGSIFSFYPEAKLAWVALFNNAQAPYDEFGDSFSQDILKRIYGPAKSTLPANTLKAVELPRAVPESYIGNYIARGDRFIHFKFHDGAFGMQDGDFYKVTFLSSVDGFITGALNAHMLRFDAAQKRETARIEWPDGPSDLDYNDGPHDIAGANERHWKEYLGEYQIMRWGKPSQKLTVQIRNGHLYLDARRLIVETQKGLFFSADGEALDFRHSEATWQNIPMQRTAD